MERLMNNRYFYFCIANCCIFLLGFGFYLEHWEGIEPCPLCIFQRIAYIAIFVIALIATMHGPGITFTRIYSSLIILSGLAGAAIAGRQVWLQHLPPGQVPECGPGLDYMLEAFPLGQALKKIFSGSGECAEVDWQFIGFSIAEWSLFWFLIFVLAGILSIYYKKPGDSYS
jgi:protein dithiol:quinone oxidoreductase